MQVSLSDEDRRNKTIIYNPFTIQQLQTTYPYINWLDFINWNLNGIVRVNEREKVTVPDKNYLQQLNGILQSTSKRTIANYYASTQLWIWIFSFFKFFFSKERHYFRHGV